MKKQLPGWVVLLVITLAAGLALGGTYALTKEPIAQQALLAAENARKAALPDADSFQELTLDDGAAVDWAYAGLKEGNTVGYVAQKTVNGFGGKVEVIAGVDTRNAPDTFTVSGITVGGSNFSETAGLGARSKEPAFTNQFAGKIYPISFIKSGGEPTDSTVDALTSATITTTAVVNGVNDIVKYIKADVMGIAGVEMPAKPADGVFSASEKGFRGPVYVEAAFDVQGKVTYMKVGDESFAEDIGAGVVEPDFMYQFIGKQMPLEVADIDVISGATISSTAVVKALNTAYALAGGAEIVVPETPTMPEKPDEGVYSASQQGFRGPVYVEAAFDADGKVTYIKVGDENFAEDIGAGVVEPEFMYQFIDKQMPLDAADIDVIAGATISSTAVVKALNDAYNLSQGIVPEVVEITLPEAPADGVYTASKQGFGGPVAVEAAFEDGKITWISIGDDKFAETPGLGAKALEDEFQAQFIGKQMPLTLADIDAIAGATVTSTAVVDALNDAYSLSQGKEIGAASTQPAAEEEKPETTYGADAFGFESDVYVEAAFEDGKVTWISIGDKRFAETAGLGAKALEPEFQAQFIGKQMPVGLSDIDAITGATFTSNAVVEALNKAYAKYQAALEAPAEPEAQKPENTVTASAQGFGGPVAVEAAFEDGKITWISIGDDKFAETPGLGAKALEDEFQAQFIGKQMPLTLADIDAIAGATVTSTAVVDALNDAYQQTQSKAAEPESTEPAKEEQKEEAKPEPTEEPNAEQEIKEARETEGEALYTGEAISFFTAIQVQAGFSDGTVSSLNVSDKPVGADAFTSSAQESAMRDRFLGQALLLDPNQNTAYASAVAVAINQAYLKAVEGQDASVAIIGGADGPTVVVVGDEDALTGEAISFFTAIQVKIAAAGNQLAALEVMEKPVGADAYSPSARNAEMQRLIGETLPLNVSAQQSSYAAAVAVAVNQAYANSLAGQQ